MKFYEGLKLEVNIHRAKLFLDKHEEANATLEFSLPIPAGSEIERRLPEQALKEVELMRVPGGPVRVDFSFEVELQLAHFFGWPEQENAEVTIVGVDLIGFSLTKEEGALELSFQFDSPLDEVVWRWLRGAFGRKKWVRFEEMQRTFPGG